MQELIKINQNHEFKRMYYKAKYKAHPYLVTYLVKNRRQCVRYGITATKKVGNACQRNRARRIIEAAARIALPEMPNGVDVIFVARKDTSTVKSGDILRVMKKHLSILTTNSTKKI